MFKSKQPWLSNAAQESVFILAPSILPVIAVLLFADYFSTSEVSTMWWVALVLCVDVSHVYSTLFRLYWDKNTFDKYRKTLLIIPCTAFVIGFLLHLYDAFLFWRILAYIAVFHFVRQQYGFVRLYSRTEKTDRFDKLIDSIAIYNATVYPLLFWHVFATEKLAWFVKGDFIQVNAEQFFSVFTALYVAIIILYVAKEIRLIFRFQMVNIPRNLIVLGTYFSWYVGIVLFQGDLIFTLLNVVAHGIPYMALIWIYGKKKASTSFSFNFKGVAVFVLVLLFLAYVEEYFWEGFVWKEREEIFPFVSSLFTIESPAILSLVVAALVLPQITHYVLDGFIWRFSKDNSARI